MHLNKWIKENKGRTVKHEEGSCVFFSIDPASLNFTLTISIFYPFSCVLQMSTVASALDIHKAAIKTMSPYLPSFSTNISWIFT